MYSFSSILSDTKNFISNNLLSILISLVVFAIIMQLISVLFLPDLSSLQDIAVFVQQAEQRYGELSQDAITQMLQTLSPQEMERIMSAAISYISRWLVVQIILIILSTSALISLVYNLVHNTLSIGNFVQHLTRVIGQIVLLALLGILMGVIIFIFFALLPPLGLILAIVGMVIYQLIFIIFSAVIIEPNPNGRFKRRLQISFQVLKREISNILPMLVSYFIVSFGLNYIAGFFTDDNFVLSAILHLLSLLINLFVICYFYRLYLLSDSRQAYDTRN